MAAARTIGKAMPSALLVLALLGLIFATGCLFHLQFARRRLRHERLASAAAFLVALAAIGAAMIVT